MKMPIMNAYVSPAKLSLKGKRDLARLKFGRPFAHEPGSIWKPPRVPVLTHWCGSRA